MNIPKKFWTNPFVVLGGTSLLFLGSQFITAVILQPFLGYIRTPSLQIALFTACNLLVICGLLTAIFKISGYTWRAIGWRWPSIKMILLVLPAFAVYFLISTTFTLLATHLIPGFQLDQAQDIGLNHLQGGEIIVAFISLVLLTPLMEELIFRGLLFRGLRVRLPFWLSAVIVSGMFALVHGQWNVAVDTFALSLILCFLTEKSNSIIPAIALHALKNCVAFILLFVIS